MTNDMSETPTPPRKPPATGNPDTREARLAAALRTNLRRRKADRAAAVPEPDSGVEQPGDDAGEGCTAQASAIPATKSPQDGS
ncbi:hypothetical protein [Maricaulis sp.]|uniref:hypothetical protein n=1 Tax=Maricaulis sp. TaxID=1486257 RepID=UPI003A954F37